MPRHERKYKQGYFNVEAVFHCRATAGGEPVAFLLFKIAAFFFVPFDIRLTVPVMKAKTLKTDKVVNLCHKMEITSARLPPTNRTHPDVQRLLFTRPNLQPRARSQGPLPSSLANSRSREEETDSWEASLSGLCH